MVGAERRFDDRQGALEALPGAGEVALVVEHRRESAEAPCAIGMVWAERAFADASPTRVWSVIQFTSQVLPPSSENDCSKCGILVLVFDQIKRM